MIASLWSLLQTSKMAAVQALTLCLGLFFCAWAEVLWKPNKGVVNVTVYGGTYTGEQPVLTDIWTPMTSIDMFLSSVL